MVYAILGLVCIFAAYMYWVNGRSIFENRSEPTDAEKETIRKIVDFEQEKLAECAELLRPFKDQAQELGIEIRPILYQRRTVNNHGKVEEHDFQKDYWLPKFYTSSITCCAYKNGEPLKEWTAHDTESWFVDIYRLVTERKSDNSVEYNHDTFDSFDLGMEQLLRRVSEYNQRVEQGEHDD